MIERLLESSHTSAAVFIALFIGGLLTASVGVAEGQIIQSCIDCIRKAFSSCYIRGVTVSWSARRTNKMSEMDMKKKKITKVKMVFMNGKEVKADVTGEGFTCYETKALVVHKHFLHTLPPQRHHSIGENKIGNGTCVDFANLLPPEILLKIFSNVDSILDFKDICNLQAVSRTIRQLVESEEFENCVWKGCCVTEIIDQHLQ